MKERLLAATAIILATVCEILDVTAKIIADKRQKPTG